jgi:CheY-like chemotaxis protein
MDLNMPVMAGDKCCFSIKADKKLNGTPVVMVIQGGNEEDFERLLAGGL